MPAIKKKWIKANQEVNDTESNGNKDELPGDEDRELAGGDNPAKAVPKASSPTKPKKRHIDPSQGGMLRGLDGEVLLEKRKRFVPPAEAKLSEWLDTNLEKRADVKLSLVQLYKYYTDLCQGDASDILDIPAFNRMIRNKFGKTVGIKESSVLKSVVKERNLNDAKKKAGSGLKLKEIAHEAINHYGNPWNGVRFFSLKQYVGTKYPFLKIDQRPKILKRILEMGVGYGQIDLVKGIGMAGFYRLPGAEPPKPKVKPGKEESKDDSKAEEADSAGSDAQEPRSKDDSAKTGEKAAEARDTAKEEKSDKLKAPKPTKLEKCNLKRIAHGNPKKIEDTFPMAITFQSAPKTASLFKIRRYIQDQYKETVGDNRWRKAVEGGAEKGHWEYISGSGITGKLHLLMDDFDPDSEHLEDMVCSAIIACHEPKAASGNQIKKYISRYHPDFQVDAKPDRFKKALIRAAERSMIVQVSGLGANGSFQLCETFVPSPKVLSGEDASSDEEESSESDEEPVYVPKGTKSRGAPLKKPQKKQEVVRKPRSAPKKATPVKGKLKPGPKPKPGGKGTPKKSGKKPTPAKGRGKSHSPYGGSDDDEEEEEEEEEQEYTPRKSQSRGGPARSTPLKRSEMKKAKESASSGKPRQPKKQARSPRNEVEDSDNVVSMPEYTPRKSQSRGGPNRTPAKDEKKTSTKKYKGKLGGAEAKSPAKKIKRSPGMGEGLITTLKMNFAEESDGADADSEPEYQPRKSSSRGGGDRKSSLSLSSSKASGKKKGKKRV